jgi:hypothetical protein
MRKIKLIINISGLIFTLLFFSCANQLPPSGGDDDLTPPRIVKISPLPNTLNYSEKTVTIVFDEYVDRRSLKEAIFISPKPSGELNYSWSGTKVEIEFPKDLLKNTTYTFVIGKGLKDIRNNSITAPIQFAFSTGAHIDNGKIHGKVFTQKSDNVMIFAYINRDVNDSLLNPQKKFPDFFTQADEKSQFYFNHLPTGKFRLFALKDNNRNLLYDFGADEISVLNDDVNLEDTLKNYTADFVFPDFTPEDNFMFSEKFLPNLSPDTSNYIFASVKNNDVNVPVDSRFIFYFKNNKLSRFDLAENMKLLDTVDKKYYRLIYNWSSDSLLEVVTAEFLKYSSVVKFVFDLTGTKLNYKHEILFNVADERKSGNINGRIQDLKLFNSPVIIKLFNQSRKLSFYNLTLESDSAYSFGHVPEGQYVLFSFVDENKNKMYDYGSPYPFKPSEKFFVFEPMLNLKGGWNIENVIVKF